MRLKGMLPTVGSAISEFLEEHGRIVSEALASLKKMLKTEKSAPCLNQILLFAGIPSVLNFERTPQSRYSRKCQNQNLPHELPTTLHPVV